MDRTERFYKIDQLLNARKIVPLTTFLDRLLHHATTLNIKGESYRLKEKRKGGLLNSPAKSIETEAEAAG